MLLKIKLNPVTICCASKSGCIKKLQSSGNLLFSGGNHGYGLTVFRGTVNFVRVYSLQKYRRKTKVIIGKWKFVAGVQMKRTQVRAGHWTATYYDIPITLLQVAGLKVEQGLRTFKISKAT